ncbi:MAG: aldo/keto reductase [Clostridia bacterium]|nr:aldo/keto reductase [Clostridia bacterium]
MLYQSIPNVDKPVSRLVFGTATPKLFAAFRSVYGDAPDFEERRQAAFSLLDDMYAEGVNCFDCADHYGEEPLGEWMEARGLRDRVVILTKGAHHNRWRRRVTDFDILHDAHDSLAKMKTDHLDIYMLHRDDPSVPVAPLVDTLNRLHDEGKIRAFGVSNWTIERFEEACEYAVRHRLQPFTVTSPNYSLARQVRDPWGGGCVSLSGPEHAKDRSWYESHGIAVFAYSVMARGFFSGRLDPDQPRRAPELLDEAGVKGYCSPDNFERLRRCGRLAEVKGLTVPRIAMAWLFSQPMQNVFALTSPTRRANMHESVLALETRLTDEECRWLDLESDVRPW